MVFKKNQIPHNKNKSLIERYGIERAKEIRKKLSDSHKGYIMPEFQKLKIKSNINNIKTRFKEGHKLINGGFTGKKHSKESNEKNRLANLGHKAWNEGTKGIMKPNKTSFKKGNIPHNFNNYSSFEPYGKEFNKKLKEQIRKKYNYRCQQCFRHQDELRTKTNRKYKLTIHHIDYNKKNNKENNLIPLCKICHSQTNYQRGDWINYFQNKPNGISS